MRLYLWSDMGVWSDVRCKDIIEMFKE